MTIKPIVPNKKQQFVISNEVDSPLDLNNHLPFQLAVVTNLLQLNKDAFIRDISHLEPREFRVLLNIGSYMPIKAADIAYLGRLDSYTVSRAVKKLIEAELVLVELCKTNMKIRNLILSEKGLSIYYNLRDSINKRTLELESVLTTEERTTIMKGLIKLERKAESMIADHARKNLDKGLTIPADQKEIIRWHRKSLKTSKE